MPPFISYQRRPCPAPMEEIAIEETGDLSSAAIPQPTLAQFE